MFDVFESNAKRKISRNRIMDEIVSERTTINALQFVVL